jgi:hypothetical protein
VVVPSSPDADLVLSHAELALGLVKGMLDPEPLILYIGKSLPAQSRAQVCEAVFEISGLVLPGHQKALAGISRPTPFPHPDFRDPDPCTKLSLAPLPVGDLTMTFLESLLHKLINAKKLCFVLLLVEPKPLGNLSSLGV